MYLVFAMCAGVIGGFMSVAIRMELSSRACRCSTTATSSTSSPPRTA